MGRPNLSLVTRTFVTVFLGLVLILVVFGFLSARLLQESMGGIFAERLQSTQVIAASVDLRIQERFRQLERVAALDRFDPSASNAGPGESALRQVQGSGYFDYAAFALDKSGVVRLVLPSLPQWEASNWSSQPFIRAALATGKPQVSGLFRSAPAVKPLVVFVVPLKDSAGQTSGLIAGALEPAALGLSSELVPGVGTGSRYSWIVDSDGLVVAASEPQVGVPPVVSSDAIQAINTERVPAVVTAQATGEGGTTTSVVLAYAPVNLAPWGVVVQEPEAETLAPIWNLQRSLVLIGLVILLATLIITLITTRSLVNPLHNLLAAFRRIDSGDFATPVAVTGRSEAAELARGLEGMRRRLLAWGDDLEAAVQKRTRELSILYTIDRAAAQSLQLEEILDNALDKITETLGFETAAIYLLNPDKETMTLRVHRGLSDACVAALQTIRTNEGIAGIAAAREEPVVLQARQIPQDRLAPYVEQESLQTLASTPLFSVGALVGVLDLGTRSVRPIPEEEIELLTSIGRQLGGAVQNARLYAKTQESLVRIMHLYDLSSEILAASTADDTAGIVANRVVQAAGADSAIITLIDDHDQVHLRIGWGSAGLLSTETTERCDRLIRRVMASVQPIVATGSADQALIPDPLAEEGIRAFIALPLCLEPRPVGGLLVRYREPRAFTSDEIQALSIYANQAATALERARLHEEMQHRLDEVSVFYEVSASLREATDVDTMLRIILSKSLEVIKAEAGSLSLVEGNQLVCRAAVGQRESLVGKGAPLGKGIEGRVAATGEIYLGGDSTESSRGTGAGKLVVEGNASDLCVPVKTAEQVIGVIHISAGEPGRLTERDAHLLTAIANIAGGAIHRANLFEQLEHRVRELATLFEVGQAVTSTLRLQDVFSLVAEVAPRALHAEGCFLFLWDDRLQRLVMRAAAGFPAETVDRLMYRQGEGLAGWVYLEGKAANVANLAADPRWKYQPEIEATLPSGEAKTALVLPVTVGSKTLGVVGVVNKSDALAFNLGDQSFLTALTGQIAIAIDNARLYEDMRGLSMSTIRSLATAIDARDPYTRGHSEEVARLTVRIAHALGWSGSDIEMLEFAALLHDVGKIAVPDTVLRSTSVLNPFEWNIIHLHPYHSAQIVKPVESLRPIIPWIYHHQERWDGTGYPDGLKAEAIPPASRIIAIADAFNAMTTDRPYRRALTVQSAVDEIERNAGTQFEPALVQTFLRIVALN